MDLSRTRDRILDENTEDSTHPTPGSPGQILTQSLGRRGVTLWPPFVTFLLCHMDLARDRARDERRCRISTKTRSLFVSPTHDLRLKKIIPSPTVVYLYARARLEFFFGTMHHRDIGNISIRCTRFSLCRDRANFFEV